jgi:hypothetical protein
MMIQVGQVTLGEMRNAYKLLVGKPEEKRPFGRPKRKWEDNIKLNLREILLECVPSVYLDRDRD